MSTVEFRLDYLLSVYVAFCCFSEFIVKMFKVNKLLFDISCVYLFRLFIMHANL